MSPAVPASAVIEAMPPHYGRFKGVAGRARRTARSPAIPWTGARVVWPLSCAREVSPVWIRVPEAARSAARVLTLLLLQTTGTSLLCNISHIGILSRPSGFVSWFLLDSGCRRSVAYAPGEIPELWIRSGRPKN